MTNQQGVSLVQFVKELIIRFQKDEVIGLSAQLAYFFLLSLFPFLIFLFTLIGHLPLSQDDVFGIIREFAPEQSMRLIETNLADLLDDKRSGLLSFGIIATIWTASNGINAIIRALNHAYDVKENRSFIKARLMAVALTIAMIFVIIVALLLPVFGKEIGVHIFSKMGMSDSFLEVLDALRWILSFTIMFVVFTFLYLLAPNKRLHIKHVVNGAFFATLGWQFVSFGFSYYVASFGNFSATYGSVGAIIVLLIWFYLTAMIIILGGEINAILQRYSEK